MSAVRTDQCLSVSGFPAEGAPLASLEKKNHVQMKKLFDPEDNKKDRNNYSPALKSYRRSVDLNPEGCCAYQRDPESNSPVNKDAGNNIKNSCPQEKLYERFIE